MTAVILAARKERESEIPFPLLPFSENQCLIDRTLGILDELKYDKVIIVAGYKAELFKRYQSDIVRVVVNKDFQFTSSMGSLACAAEYIDEDFVLIEGDTFFEKKVIEVLSQKNGGNCLVMTEESGTGDECFVETRNGFVTKITKDRHRVCRFEGELLGVSRINIGTFHDMLRAWEGSNNPYLNYEFLLMDCTDAIDRPCIKFKNLIWGDVDSMSGFVRLKDHTFRKLCKKENPYDHDNLIAHLKTVFGSEDVKNAEINQIGGLSNKNFKVTYKGKDYVLRVPGYGSDGMVNRSCEEQNSFLASQMGINPPICYFDSNTGLKLTDFIEGAETLTAATIQRTDIMDQCAEIFRILHNSKVRFNNDFNLFGEILKYEDLLRAAKSTMYDGYDEFRPKVFALQDRLNKIGVSLKPCHNDLLYENWVKSSDGKVWLLDWEYSGMNDPASDFAALFVEADFSEDNQDYILDKYFKGELPTNFKEKILIYEILLDTLWSIWTVIKEAKGDDFGSYGPNRFNRALANYELLKNKY